MVDKEKMQQIKDRIISFFKKNKLLLIIASSVCIITMMLMINIHVLQMTFYTMQNNTSKIIEILEKDLAKSFRKDDWYFNHGINYLLDDMSEESQLFLETNYKALESKAQEEIISVYNEKELLFKQNNKDIFCVIATQEVGDTYKEYMKRMDIPLIEKTLKLYMGEDTKVTQDTVDRLFKILSMQKGKISLNEFSLSIYEIMSFSHAGEKESTALKLLDYIQPEATRNVLFTELKTRPIEIEVLSTWVDILNRKKVISTSEYARFTSSYGSIKRMQDQYKQVLLQEVDLMNVKQKIDVQTEEVSNKIIKLEKETTDMEKEIQTQNQELDKLKQYGSIELYVLDQYENGDYEVAIPEKSWLFNTYKPSKERIRLKVNTSVITTQGVMRFNVYERGESSDGLPYYVEVSQEEYDKIATLESSISNKTALKNTKQQEIDGYKQEIAQIRKINNYDQTILLIEEVVAKKESIQIEIKKEKVEIQNLFQIGEITIQRKE